MSDTKVRNHYVPKFLLNRFASRVQRKTRFVWQFSKERPPVEISTRDAGVSAFFYGQPANGVEDRLQSVEGTQADVLADIDRGVSPAVHSETLRRLLWMLAVRTNALRQQFVAAGTTLLDHLEDSAGSDEASAGMRARIRDECDGQIRQALARLPGAYRVRALELYEDPARQEAFRELIMSQVGDVDFQGFIRWFRERAGDMLDLNKSAAKGQIRGLSALLDRPDAPPVFAPTHWDVIRRPLGTFVLGDGCVFATALDGRVGSPFAFKGTWRAVYLPISSSAVLVAAPCPIDAVLPDESINAASVELGADVFFACRCSEQEKSLVPRIGTGVPLISDDEMAKIARNSWSDRKRKESRSATAE